MSRIIHAHRIELAGDDITLEALEGFVALARQRVMPGARIEVGDSVLIVEWVGAPTQVTES